MAEEPKPDAAAAGEQPPVEGAAEGAPAEIDPLADPLAEGADVPKTDEGLPEAPKEPEPPKSNIPEQTMEDMKNLWDVFDTEKANAVPIMNLGTILRALDIDLTDKELEVVAKQIDPPNEEGEVTGFIAFEKLVDVMEEKLKDTETIEDFVKAMSALDQSGDGAIDNPIFKQMMMNTGQKLTLEQYDELMEVADKKGDGQVIIQDFAESICPPKD